MDTADLADGSITPAKLGSGSYGINISGNAATATTATNAVTATSFSGPLAGDVTGSQGATKVGKLQGRAVSNTAPTSGQVLKYDGAAWAPADDTAGVGTVTSVGTGTGLTGGPITGAGTIDLRLNGTGGLSKTLGAGSNELGIADGGVTPSKVASGSYGISITGNAATATSAAAFSGALSGDVTGTQGATKVVKLQNRAVASTAPTGGQVLKYNAGTSQWEPSGDTVGTGTVTSVGAGPGLTGGPITGSGSLEVRLNGAGGLSKTLGAGSNELGIAAGGVTPAMVASGTYGISVSGNAATATSATSATSFTGPLAGDVTGSQGATAVTKIRGKTVSTTAPTAGQVLKYNAGTAQWEPAADDSGAGGSVQTVNTGAGLSGGPITTTGTIDVRLNTAGGLSKTLGTGTNELGIAAGGVKPAMVASGTYGINISGNAATATTASSATTANSATTATSATSFTGALNGDVTGTQGATSVQKIKGIAVTGTPASGQVLKYNGTQWAPAADNAGAGGTVTTVNTGQGLSGGPISSAGTINLDLASGGGLSKTVGTGAQLGIAAGGVTPSMVAGGTYGINISGSAASASSATSATTAGTATSFSGALNGDVTGTQGNTSVQKIKGVAVTGTPSSGQVLKYNGSQWAPAADNTGSGVTAVTASAPLSSSGGASPNITLSGTVPINRGGTGITAGPTAAGQFLRSSGNGTWAVSGLQAGDVPGGSGSYIHNGTGAQSANFNISGTGTMGALSVGGTGTAGGDLRAPIFYDLNNTGYYVNPDGTTQLHYVLANNWFRAQGQTGFYFESYGGGWYMTDTTWVRAYNNKALWVNNEIQSTSNVRAPIFYDLNDGGYYTDPNGTSRMNAIYPNVISCMSSWCPANNLARLTPNLHFNALQGYAVILNWDNGSVGAGTQQLRIGNGQGGDVFYVRADGLAYGVQFRDINDGSYYLDPASVSYLNDVRANIYYDRQDTNFYSDPNGNSRLANVHTNANLLNWPGYNGLAQAYGHYVWPGRNDGSGASWQQSWYLASHSSWGLYTNTGIYIVGTSAAPFIYDQQDTNWYLDPNGTTRINAVQIGGRVAYDGGCPAPFTSYGTTPSNSGYSNKLCRWLWSATNFQEAQKVCYAFGGHICSYTETYILAQAYGTSPRGVGSWAGDWIGNRATDDVAYCVNYEYDLGNFEGHCNKNDGRWYTCCYGSTYIP